MEEVVKGGRRKREGREEVIEREQGKVQVQSGSR